MNKITLSTGTVLEDDRDIGFGISITQPRRDFAGLAYNSLQGFYAITTGCRVYEEEFNQHAKEIKEVFEEVKEANKLLTQ